MKERYWNCFGRLCFGPYSDVSAYCQLCALCWKWIDGDLGETFYKGKNYHHECANIIINKDHKQYVKEMLASPERCQYQLLQWQRRKDDSLY